MSFSFRRTREILVDMGTDWVESTDYYVCVETGGKVLMLLEHHTHTSAADCRPFGNA